MMHTNRRMEDVTDIVIQRGLSFAHYVYGQISVDVRSILEAIFKEHKILTLTIRSDLFGIESGNGCLFLRCKRDPMIWKIRDGTIVCFHIRHVFHLTRP